MFHKVLYFLGLVERKGVNEVLQAFHYVVKELDYIYMEATKEYYQIDEKIQGLLGDKAAAEAEAEKAQKVAANIKQLLGQ